MAEFTEIDAVDFDSANAIAQQTFAKFQRTRGHYNNTFDSHLRGKLGEIAVEKWCVVRGIRVDAAFRQVSRIKEADLVVTRRRKLRLDVKTWNQTHWEKLGRCVAESQLKKLEAKADGVVWCVSPSLLAAKIQVEIVGWNSLDDIKAAPRRMTGPNGGRQVDNFQVDRGAIRPLSDLLTALNAT